MNTFTLSLHIKNLKWLILLEQENYANALQENLPEQSRQQLRQSISDLRNTLHTLLTIRAIGEEDNSVEEDSSVIMQRADPDEGYHRRPDI